MLQGIEIAEYFLSLRLASAGLGRELTSFMQGLGLSPVGFILVVVVLYIVLGFFIETLSLMVVTIPIIVPMVLEQGYDVIWFGIFIVVVVEMAQVTPPIGFNLFVLQGMTKHEIGYIAKTALPMVGLMLVMVGILVVWPELATWLPENTK